MRFSVSPETRAYYIGISWKGIIERRERRRLRHFNNGNGLLKDEKNKVVVYPTSKPLRSYEEAKTCLHISKESSLTVSGRTYTRYACDVVQNFRNQTDSSRVWVRHRCVKCPHFSSPKVEKIKAEVKQLSLGGFA